MAPVFYNPQDADNWAKAGATLTRSDPNIPQAFEYQPSTSTSTYSNGAIVRPKAASDETKEKISKLEHAERTNDMYSEHLEPFNPGSWQIWVDARKVYIQKWRLGTQGKTQDFTSKQHGKDVSKENSIYPKIPNMNNPKDNSNGKEKPYWEKQIQELKDTTSSSLDLMKLAIYLYSFGGGFS
ncbi:hypothetical protein DFH28DRAFT_174437 [Melampsora americana]|nr:hypothetical protein DFH28DRAFT_174437 [Melampsora americana]